MAQIRTLWQKLIFGKKERKKTHWLLSTALGVSVIGASAYLLFSSPILAPAADEMLPGQNLRFYAESASLECSPSLRLKAPDLCKRQEELISAIVGDFPQRIAAFADRIAVASYTTGEGTKPPVVALRLTNSREAERYLLSSGSFAAAKQETVEGVSVYLISEPLSRAVFFWRGWLVFAPDKGLIGQLVAVRQGQAPAARASELVSSLGARLPSGSDARLYADSAVLIPRLPASFAPLGEFVPRVGITARQTSDKIVIEIAAQAPDLIAPSSDQPANQLKHLIEALPSEDLAAMAAISDFTQQLELVMAYFEKQDPAFALSLRGQAQQMIRTLFGEGISLETDILPLLANEVVLIASRPDDAKTLAYALVAETGDGEFLLSKQEKLTTAFANAAARFVPRVLSHTLEDGTVIREVAACSDCVKTSSEQVGKGQLTNFEATDQSESTRALALGSLEGTLAAANHTEPVRRFLENRQKMGQKTPLFLLEIDNFDRLAEIFVLRPEKMVAERWPALAWLNAFETVVITRSDAEGGFLLTGQAYFPR